MPVKSFILGKRHTGRSLSAALGDLMGLSRQDVSNYLKNRWVRIDGTVCQNPNQRVRVRQHLQVEAPRPKSHRTPPALASKETSLPAIARAIRIVYLDDVIVVVDKPAGLTTVRHAEEAERFGTRGKRFLPPTLVDLLPRVEPKLRSGRVRAVHRIDKETSGLVILARTKPAESHLGKQFRAHSVERSYLAVVRGEAKDERIESQLLPDRGDGRRGSASSAVDRPASQGQRAVTHVQVLERLGKLTLVGCRLETGRTHQVRIHLGERGTPLCGERVYDRPLHGQPLPDPSGAKRPLLHAATLAVDHPETGKRIGWEAMMPSDMQEALGRHRAQRG